MALAGMEVKAVYLHKVYCHQITCHQITLSCHDIYINIYIELIYRLVNHCIYTYLTTDEGAKMSFINTAEVKSKIAFHQAQIRALEGLLEIGDLLSDKPGSGAAAKATRGRKPGSKGKRGKKRGMLSGAIIALLENSPSPLQAGDIKRVLVEQGVADKKSTSVYAMLLQMDKRGSIKKTKTPSGMVYTAAQSGAGAVKPKRRGRKPGRKKDSTAKQPAGE
jgi:DNA-binding PadR family transcriptional regulator